MCGRVRNECVNYFVYIQVGNSPSITLPTSTSAITVDLRQVVVLFSLGNMYLFI